jgi:hypothetical protein
MTRCLGPRDSRSVFSIAPIPCRINSMLMLPFVVCDFQDSIKYNNDMFLRVLPPEKAALVQPMSPLSSPNALVGEDELGQLVDMDLDGASQAQGESSQMVVDVGGV